MSDKSAVCGVVCHGLIGKPKPHQVIWRHGINGCVRIGSREFARARFGRRGKLAFKSSDSFVFDFKKIELMRVVAGRAPEVHVGKVVSNAVQFHAFHEEEVFPQGAAILAGSGYHWAEVTDDRVPDAIVAEVDYKKRFARNPSTLALLIMSSLEDSPGLDKAELCRRTGFTQTRVAGQIETLLREGVIELVGDGYRLVNTTGLSSNSLPEDAGSEASIDDPTAVILRLVSEKQVIRRDDVVKALSVTPQKAYRLLKTMTTGGLLTRSGARRTTVYRLPDARERH